MTIDIDHLRQYIGRSESHSDAMSAMPAAALAATLNLPAPFAGAPLPPLWHWLYFLPLARQSDLGPDGHPRGSGLLPEIPLPRRMWAGSRITYLQPLKTGEPAQKVATLTKIDLKQGQSGPLVFVQTRYEMSHAAGVAVVEEQDIVYREAAVPGAAAPPAKQAPTDALWEKEVRPDPMLLFRYSALTFNAHRIHYDRPYVTGVEGYPGLVVHGPLIATLLAGLVREHLPEAKVKAMTIRAMSPLFDIAPFTVCGRPEVGDAGNGALLWAKNAEGGLAMEIKVEYS